MPDIKLITLNNPRSEAAEAYRALRTQLMYGSAGKALHTILITSAAKDDGKSAAAANLAAVLAQSGQRTILVDADLHRPAQATIWGVSAQRGLDLLMSDDRSLANPPLVETSVPNLSLLLPGELTGVPADVLTSQRMSEIIGLLKARSDYIVFDAPPVLATTDASILAPKVDGVVLVVRAGSTRTAQVERAKRMLESVNARILGAALTNARAEMHSSY
jgi:capsular exopolysaccharide synthesis family protein